MTLTGCTRDLKVQSVDKKIERQHADKSSLGVVGERKGGRGETDVETGEPLTHSGIRDTRPISVEGHR